MYLNRFSLLKSSKMNNKQLLEQILIADKWGVMLNKGVPLLKSLECLSEEHPSYSRQISDIRKRIMEGSPFYSSMDKKRFHHVLINLAYVGEATGSLDISLSKAAQVLGKELHVRKENPPYGEKVVFYSQLGGMLEQGCPLVSSLNVVTHSDFFVNGWKRQVKNVAENIERGEIFSDALARCKLFEKIDTRIINEGEVSGMLDVYVNKLGNYYEILSNYKKLNEGDKIIFYEQLGMLLDEDYKHEHELKALDIIKDCSHLSKNWRKMVACIIDDMITGASLPEAMSRYKVFKKSEIEILKQRYEFDEMFSNLARIHKHSVYEI